MAGIRIIGVVALSIAVASLQPADAAVFTGEARGTDFAFLGKFCFGYNGASCGGPRLAPARSDAARWQLPRVGDTAAR